MKNESTTEQEDPRGWPIDYNKELCGGPVQSPGGCTDCAYRGFWVPHNKVTTGNESLDTRGEIIIRLELDINSGLYELCVSEQQGQTRLRHDDYILNREDLWKLKQQVDMAWFGEVEPEVVPSS